MMTCLFLLDTAFVVKAPFFLLWIADLPNVRRTGGPSALMFALKQKGNWMKGALPSLLLHQEEVVTDIIGMNE